MTQSESQSLRIAVLGGGLAGAALCRSLSKLPHLQVDIFEAAPVFREQGIGIGVNKAGIWALELMNLRQCLEDAGAVRMGAGRSLMGYGPEMRTLIRDASVAKSDKGLWITQRAPFLEQLLKGIEPARMHNNKKLSELQQGKDITLTFEDGTTHCCDVVLGADGIRSTTRQFVVEPDQVEASFSGWSTVWTKVPYETAVKHLGEDAYLNAQDPAQIMWIGPGAVAMHDLMTGASLVQCAISKRIDEDDTEGLWNRTISREELRELFEGWDPRLRDGYVDMVCETTAPEPLPLRPFFHHRSKNAPGTLPPIVKGAVGLVGDATGATTPWQGSGGTMSLVDAYMLSQLFADVRTASDARAALLAYDQVNRPIRARLIQSSYEVGLLATCSYPGVGVDAKKLQHELKDRWEWIYDLPLEKNRDEAVQYMRKVVS